MKILQRTTALGLLTILLVTFFVSCKDLKNTFGSGINFTSPEEVKTLNESVNKAIKPDMLIQEIEFTYSNAGSDFSNYKDVAEIRYVDPEDNTILHGIDVNLKTGDCSPNQLMEEQTSHVKRVQKGVKLENFDFSKIADIVNAAVQAMQDEQISSDGIGPFSIDFSSGDMEKMRYVFSLQHRTGSRTYGKRIEYQYDEYDFKADKDGNLEF